MANKPFGKYAYHIRLVSSFSEKESGEGKAPCKSGSQCLCLLPERPTPEDTMALAQPRLPRLLLWVPRNSEACRNACSKKERRYKMKGHMFNSRPGTLACLRAKSFKSCPILCDPVDCSPSGSSVHGTLQARRVEWVAVPSSRGSSQPRGRTHVSCLQHWQAGSLPLAPPGKFPRYPYLPPFL